MNSGRSISLSKYFSPYFCVYNLWLSSEGGPWFWIFSAHYPGKLLQAKTPPVTPKISKIRAENGMYPSMAVPVRSVTKLLTELRKREHSHFKKSWVRQNNVLKFIHLGLILIHKNMFSILPHSLYSSWSGKISDWKESITGKERVTWSSCQVRKCSNNAVSEPKS